MAIKPDSLVKGHCVPCEGGVQPMTRNEFAVYLPQISEWKVADNELAISRKFIFKDFKHALAFVNQVGELAEAEGHHPNILMHDWKYVTIMLTTHAISGLSINDFVLAAKIDELVK